MPAAVLASSACAANRLMTCAGGSAITTSSRKRSRTSASSTTRCCGRMAPRRDAQGRTHDPDTAGAAPLCDGLIAEEVKDLHEEVMKHAARELGYKVIVAAIFEVLAKRNPL